MQGALIDNLVRCVETESVEVKFGDPVERIVHQVAPNLVALGSIQIPAVSPRRTMPVREVGPELRQVVPLGAEMIVDHVENGCETHPMAGIHQALESIGTAIRALRSVERD